MYIVIDNSELKYWYFTVKRFLIRLALVVKKRFYEVDPTYSTYNLHVRNQINKLEVFWEGHKTLKGSFRKVKKFKKDKSWDPQSPTLISI